MAAQALEPTLVLQSLVIRQGPAELESSCSGDYTGAAEPSGKYRRCRASCLLLRTLPNSEKKWQVHSAALRSLLLTQGSTPRGRFLLRLVASLDHAAAPPNVLQGKTATRSSAIAAGGSTPYIVPIVVIGCMSVTNAVYAFGPLASGMTCLQWPRMGSPLDASRVQQPSRRKRQPY